MQTAQGGADPGAGPERLPPNGANGGTPAPAAPPERRLGVGNGRTNGDPTASTGPSGAATGADDIDDAGDDGTTPAWNEGWRESLARGDAARLKRLERYATPDAIADALFSAQDRIRQGGRTPVLPEDATEDEIKAFRKAHGIPETAKDYGLAWPEGMKPNEQDAAGLAAFAEFMHAKHIPPAAVKAAFEYYTSAQAAAATYRAEQAHELNSQNIAELRREYGREFKRNMTIAEEFLARHFEGREEALDKVLDAELSDGSGLKVRNFAPYIMGLVDMGRANADDDALYGGDGAGGGKTIDAEYKELVDKSATSRLSADENNRLMQLAEARQARGEKQGRRTQAA